MSKRTIFTYLYRGGIALDVPNGCWVRGAVDFGTGDAGDALMLQIRAAAGQTMPINAPLGSKWILSDYDEIDQTGGRFGKDWFVSTTGGRAICAYVDVDSSLNVTTCNGLKSLFKQNGGGPTLWAAPYNLAYGAGDCMAAIHASHFRGQVWWVQSSYLSGKYTTGATKQVYSTSNSAGAFQDWVAPQSQLTGKTQIPVSGQEYGVPTSVISLLPGQATRSFLPGPDGRTWACMRGARTVNADNGQGDNWTVGNGTGPNQYNVAGNTSDGSPYLPRNAKYAGKSLPQITTAANQASAGVIACSDVARTDDGTLYQLLYTSSYSRLVPATHLGKPYDPERGANNQDLTIPPNAIINDPPTSDTQAMHYSVAVPADTNKIQYVRFNWINQLFPHAPIKGVLNDTKKPTKITFAIPSWPEIPAFQPISDPAYNPTHNPYYGVTNISMAYVHCDFTYQSASSFYYHVGRLYHASDGVNAKYIGDLPPSMYQKGQSAGTLAGYSFPVEGRGEIGFQPKPLPYLDKKNRLQLDLSRNIDIDKARGGTVTFDIEEIGDPGAMLWKDCYLTVYPLAPVSRNYTSNIVSAMPNNNAHPSIPTNNTATVVDYEFSGSTSYVPSYQPGEPPAPNSFLDEINAAYGQAYNFDLVYVPGKYATGGPQRHYNALLDQYVQFGYNLATPDFFLVRSRDGGETWEFAADSKPIAGLSHLRDFNNSTNRFGFGQPLIPSLIAEENNIFLVWIFGGAGQNGAAGEAHPVKTLGSQDGGETWMLGNSFVPDPPR